MELILKKAEKYKSVEIFKRLCFLDYTPSQKKETQVFQHTADLSMQMHLISQSLSQVLLVNYSFSSMRTASSLLYLRASLIVIRL